MPLTYTIKQGDYLAKIAKEQGFSDWKILWDHPNNKALKDKRKDPNILYPGDQLFISDKEEKLASIGVDNTHKFTVKRSKLKLVLVLDEMFKSPMAGVQYQLVVDGKVIAKAADSKGKLEVDIPAGAIDVQLIIKNPESPVNEVVIPIKIGHLDPIEEHSGQAQRLNNLGYFGGPQAENDVAENERIFLSAVQEFQCDNTLRVDGVCGPQTQSKLVQIHGA